jgi:hypothetical protein
MSVRLRTSRRKLSHPLFQFHAVWFRLALDGRPAAPEKLSLKLVHLANVIKI